jgi:V/A-type H+-transporting ATPase subunit E
MSNINNLTSKIIGEAKIKCDEIIGSAHKSANKIIDSKIAEAKSIEEDIISKAKKEAVTMKDRIISNAELTSRNNKLSAKQAIIDKVFIKALEDLNSISEEEYLAFIKNKIVSMDLRGDYNLIVTEKIDINSISTLIEDLNNNFLKYGKVILSSNRGKFQGGFILERNGIEINSTFEALIGAMRDDLEYEVTKALFN